MNLSYKNNARFCSVYPHVLTVEGGYVNDPHDSGGPTKFGISLNNNRGYLRAYGIVDAETMKDLRLDQAVEIYYRKYWLPSQADEIPDTRLALVYFDHCINAGQGAADPILAKLDKKLWYYDGDGPNANYWWGLTVEFLLRRLWFYTRLGQWGRYGLGWFNRLLHLVKVLPKV